MKPLKNIILAAWVGGCIVAACLLVVAPGVSQWGQLHEPHAGSRVQLLKSGESVGQTFLLEYPTVDTILLWLDGVESLPQTGQLILDVQVGARHEQVSLAYTDVLSDGTAIFPLPHKLRGRAGQAGKMSLSLAQSNQLVRVRFQIDATKYPDGQLLRQDRPLQGDLAFQIHYDRYALGSQGRQRVYAVFLLVAGGWLTWLAHQNWPRERFSIERREWFWLGGVGIGVFLFYAWWLLGYMGWWVGPGDFVKDVSYVTATSAALVAGQWPGWSHLICGGMPLLGNPEANVLSFSSLLALVIDPEKSLWLLLALEAGIGAAGVYALARLLRVSRFGSALAAVIALLSAAYPYRIVEGFTMIGGAVAWAPWVLVGMRQTMRSRDIRWSILAGLALTLMFWRGEVHILTALIIWLVIWTALECSLQKGWRPLLLASSVAAVFFMSGSVKLLAYLEQPDFFAAQYRPYSALLIRDQLIDDVFLAVHSRFLPIDVQHGKRAEEWANFGAYVGLVPLGLAAVGIWQRRRDWLIVAIGLGVSLVIAEGTVYDLWLRHLGPLAGLLRIPTRGLALVVIFLGVAAGAGLDRLISRLSLRIGIGVAMIVLVVVTLDLARADGRVFSETLGHRTRLPVATLSDSTQLAFHANESPEDKRHAGVLLRQGYSLPKLCADVVAEPDFVDDKADEFAISQAAVVVQPNRFFIQTTGEREYMINERFTSGWIASPGGLLPDRDGLMRVIVSDLASPAIEVRYIQSLRWVEMWLFGLTGAVAVFMMWPWNRMSKHLKEQLPTKP